jgi:carbonic anhydrase
MKVKHIAVMGHTDCGGIRACLEQPSHLHDVTRYLEPLEDVHRKVAKEGGDMQTQARKMEQEAVRQSIRNLRRYKVVADAERAGLVALHGWMVDVGTQLLSVMDRETGEFRPMVEKKP